MAVLTVCYQGETYSGHLYTSLSRYPHYYWFVPTSQGTKMLDDIVVFKRDPGGPLVPALKAHVLPRELMEAILEAILYSLTH